MESATPPSSEDTLAADSAMMKRLLQEISAVESFPTTRGDLMDLLSKKKKNSFHFRRDDLKYIVMKVDAHLNTKSSLHSGLTREELVRYMISLMFTKIDLEERREFDASALSKYDGKSLDSWDFPSWRCSGREYVLPGELMGVIFSSLGASLDISIHFG